MKRSKFAPLLAVAALLVARHAEGQGSPAPTTPAPSALAIRASQVTITVPGPRTGRFQATVIARRGHELVAVTAAHCLASIDEGKEILINRGEAALRGQVIEVARNPAFEQPRFATLMGTDNAVVSLRVLPGEANGSAEALEAIRPAGLVAGPFPPPAGDKVVIRISDQYGQEHLLPAGNFSNPKILTWGPKFHPIAGDSGSGVFLTASRKDGTPILIGVVVGSDDRGGAASLIHRRLPWVAKALNGGDDRNP